MMTPLKFRYRYPATATTPKALNEADGRYLRFLRGQGLQSTGVLLQYFGADFFHDGPIEDLRLEPAAQQLSFRVQACWIQPKDPIEARRVGTLACWFQCSFHDVAWYGLTLDPHPQTQPFGNGGGEDEYLYSEINTLTAQLRYYRKECGNICGKSNGTFSRSSLRSDGRGGC